MVMQVNFGSLNLDKAWIKTNSYFVFVISQIIQIENKITIFSMGVSSLGEKFFGCEEFAIFSAMWIMGSVILVCVVE